MSLNLGIMSAAVTLDDKDYRNTLAGLESSSQKSFSKIAAYAASYLSLRAISQFAVSTIKTYSDLEEETNKFSVVFAGLGLQTSRILKQMRDDFGLSELAAKRMLAGTGDILTGFGFDKDVALALSEGAAKLGADIASFSNYAGGAEGATTALTKAMLGEAESAKLLGVVIRQDSDEYKDLVNQAMTTGITIDALGKTFKVSSEQQAKAVAALALAYQQSPNAIGDFVRSQDSIANQQRILQNNFEQLTATIGGDLAPAYKTVVTSANSLLSAYNNLSPVARSLTNDAVVLSAALLVLNKTKFGANVKKFFSDLTASNETQKIALQEEQKRAEIKKTDAVYEAVFARQKMRLAQKTQEEAEASLKTIQFQKMEAEAKGDAVALAAAANAEAKARVALTKATIEARKSEQEYQAKRSESIAATQKYVAVSKGVAASTRLTGVSAFFSASGFKAAALSVKTFFASIGPVGWALIAAGVAFEAISLAVSKYNSELKENAEKAKEAADKANELADSHDKEINSTLKNLDRLQELAQYERLSNAEKEEAIDLLRKEGVSYHETGESIADIIDLKDTEAESLEDLIKLRKEDLKLRKLALLQDQLEANNKAIAANEERRHGHWGTFWEFFANPTDTAVSERDAEINAENRRYYDLNDKIREQIRLLNEDEKNLGKTQKERAKLTAKEAKKQRNAINSIEKRKFEIEFERSDAEKQVQMINVEIDKIFQQQSGKYATVDAFVNADLSELNTKELEAVKKIIDLEKQRADIKKRSADYFKQEQEDFQEYLADRQRDLAAEKIEKQIRQKQKLGDDSGAMEIMRQQLANAQKAAAVMKRQYDIARTNAQKDGIPTKEEEKKIEQLKAEVKRLMSEGDRWKSRIDSETEKQDNATKNAVGSFSAEVLQAMLGAPSKPEQQTAKNTKKTVEILEKVSEQLTNGSTKYDA